MQSLSHWLGQVRVIVRDKDSVHHRRLNELFSARLPIATEDLFDRPAQHNQETTSRPMANINRSPSKPSEEPVPSPSPATRYEHGSDGVLPVVEA